MIAEDVPDPAATPVATDVVLHGEPMSQQQIDARRLRFAAECIRLRPSAGVVEAAATWLAA